MKQSRKQKNFMQLLILNLIIVLTIIACFIYLGRYKVVVVDNIAINIRSGPGVSYDVQTQAKKGDHLTVLSKKNQWYNVRLADNSTGWVASWLVEQGNANSSTNIDATVNTDGTKLRERGSTDSQVLATLKNGQKVTVTLEQNGWAQVEVGKKEGWINSSLLDVTSKTGTNSATATKGATSIAEATIVLDPGHGGADPGAESTDGKLFEKNMTLSTVKIVKEQLEKLGANVVLTRSSDTFISLSSIAEISNNAKADAFISFHFDSSENANEASGTTTYYYNDTNKNLAADVNKYLAANLPLQNRGYEFADYQVLRENKRPALLLELGYMNNDSDIASIKTKAYQKKIATAVVAGLKDYFK